MMRHFDEGAAAEFLGHDSVDHEIECRVDSAQSTVYNDNLGVEMLVAEYGASHGENLALATRETHDGHGGIEGAATTDNLTPEGQLLEHVNDDVVAQTVLEARAVHRVEVVAQRARELEEVRAHGDNATLDKEVGQFAHVGAIDGDAPTVVD